MSEAKPLLTLRNLDVAFPEHHAVRDLNVTLAAGRSLALVGESGCGKSTTALSILRLLPDAARVQGEILFEQQNLMLLDETALARLRGNRIGMIFQEPMTSLNPVLTIGTQISEPLRLHRGLSARAARGQAIELLDLVKVPEPHRRIDDYQHRLSGGQRQRVMIAAAIACRPTLLIADEPTTALDVTIQAQILSLLDDLRKELGMALLLITHDLGVVADWADDVAVMYAGEIVERAGADTFFSRPIHAYSQGLLGSSLSLGEDAHYRRVRLPEIRVEQDSPADAPRFTLVEPPRVDAASADIGANSSGPPILAVQDLHTRYETPDGWFHAVRGVSFTIAAGETLGLVGESGCGKSTLSKTLIRLVDPASGTIRLDGDDIANLSRARLKPYRSRMQMVFQDPYASLNPRHTLQELLDFALTIHEQLPDKQRRQRIVAMLDAVGLPRAALGRYPQQFSGGQRQRIGIARALILRPRLLICDEPVSALDVSVQAQILNLLVDLKQEFGLSLLFISHDLAVVRYIADRVMVMNQGRIVESGSHDRIWHEPEHDYTRTLLAAVPGHRHPQRAAHPQPL